MSNSSKFWLNWIYVEWWLQQNWLVNLGDAISWVMSTQIHFKQCSLSDPPSPVQCPWPKRTSDIKQTAKMAHVGFPESKYEGEISCHTNSSIYWVPFSYWRQIYVIYFSPASEHSIHPEPRKDPWELEFLPDNGYKFQIVKGVYQVENYHLVDVFLFVNRCRCLVDVDLVDFVGVAVFSLFFNRCTEAKRIFCHGQRSLSIMRWGLRKLQIS